MAGHVDQVAETGTERLKGFGGQRRNIRVVTSLWMAPIS